MVVPGPFSIIGAPGTRNAGCLEAVSKQESMNIRHTQWTYPILAGACLVIPILGQDDASSLDELHAQWSARHVEHLFNRAGFGASAKEIETWVPAGPEKLVEHLLTAPPAHAYPVHFERIDRVAFKEADDEQRRLLRNAKRVADRKQRDLFLDYWLDSMIEGRQPLSDRMALFWHGHFTSSFEIVRHSALMIQQISRFRREGMGNFGSLLKAMLHDPALLIYLDNDANREDRPNENLAREVMELFALGVGNFGEQDVSEAARALTGYTVGDQIFVFLKKHHDIGRKKILGIRGRHNADDLVEILSLIHISEPTRPY